MYRFRVVVVCEIGYVSPEEYRGSGDTLRQYNVH